MVRSRHMDYQDALGLVQLAQVHMVPVTTDLAMLRHLKDTAPQLVRNLVLVQQLAVPAVGTLVEIV